MSALADDAIDARLAWLRAQRMALLARVAELDAELLERAAGVPPEGARRRSWSYDELGEMAVEVVRAGPGMTHRELVATLCARGLVVSSGDLVSIPERSRGLIRHGGARYFPAKDTAATTGGAR